MARSKRKVRVTGLGNHSKDWEPTSRDVPTHAPNEAAIADYGAQEALQPAQADMRSAFGEPIEEPGGKVRWSIDMTKRENRGKFKELTQARRRKMIERSGRMNGAHKVPLINRETGERSYVPDDLVDNVARNGNLKVLSRRLVSNVQAGPHGMLFKRAGAGRWWPTGRKCLGTPLDDSDPFDVDPVQEDPDGVVWVRHEGEWLAQEEAVR